MNTDKLQKTIPLTLRLSKEQHAKLSKKAKELAVSLNSIISATSDIGLMMMEGKITIQCGGNKR